MSAPRRILAGFAAAVGLAASPAFAIEPPPAPPIAARAYVLIDAQSGQTLAALGAEERFEPASLTKLMTARLVLEAIRAGRLDREAKVKVSERAWKAGGARMFLDPATPATVGELLNGMIVQSGNDAAIALAEAVAGSEEAFVALMNREAKRLGLADTAFANATGMPAPDHHASARDLARLAASLIHEHPGDYALYSQKEYTYNRITQSNRNRLLWIDPTVDGVKTGFTESAGYGLVASARRGERRLISVVLGAKSDALRTSESQKLLNFGFQAFETRRLYRKGEAVATPEIFKGTSRTLRLGFARDVWLTLPRDRFAGIRPVLETRQPFVAPFSAGQKAGIMRLTRDNATLAEFALVALEDVPVAGFLSRGWDTLRLLFR